jgi:hypothetical protein
MGHLGRSGHEDVGDLHAEDSARALSLDHHSPGRPRGGEMRNAGQGGDNRLEVFEPLHRHLGHRGREPRDVATGARQRRDEVLAEGVTGEGHHDRNRASGGLDGSHGCGCRGDDHVDLETNELRGEIGNPVDLAVRVACLDRHVLPLDITEGSEASPECL